MKKTLTILFFTIFTLTVNAQKKDTTIYAGCAFHNEPFIAAEHETNIFADQCPQFPGGYKKFKKFLTNNLKWPDKSGMIDVQGKVWLSFIIEQDGHLTNIKVVKTLEPTFDAEAIRVMKHSPKWIPAKKNMASVRCRYSIPISFHID